MKKPTARTIAKRLPRNIELPTRRKPRRRKAVVGGLVGLAALAGLFAAIPAAIHGLTEWVGRGINIRSLED